MIGFTRQILLVGKRSGVLLPKLSLSRFWFASKTVSLPFLTDSINEGTIKSFDRKEGQWVNKDDPIANVQTDKVTVTVRSPHSGLVTKCHMKIGDKLQVGKPLFDVDPDANKPEPGQKSNFTTNQTQSSQTSSTTQNKENISNQTKHGLNIDPNKPASGQQSPPKSIIPPLDQHSGSDSLKPDDKAYGDKIKDKVKDKVVDAKDKAEDMKDKIKDKVQDIKDKIKYKAEDIKDKMHETKEKIKDKFEETKDKIKNKLK